jgi:uncharacterized protein (DUF2147 family)
MFAFLQAMKYLMIVCFLGLIIKTQAQNEEDAILGKWESVEKNLIVEVYKQEGTFKAKIVWFYDENDTITPIEERLDTENPNKSLRNRKILGLQVLSGLVYNARQERWVNGKIYDSSSGRTWSATVWLTDVNTLQVRGYYLVRWLGKTLTFTRVSG